MSGFSRCVCGHDKKFHTSVPGKLLCVATDLCGCRGYAASTPMPQNDAESALSPRDDGSTGGATGETENALGVDLEAIRDRAERGYWAIQVEDVFALLAHIDRLEREVAIYQGSNQALADVMDMLQRNRDDLRSGVTDLHEAHRAQGEALGAMVKRVKELERAVAEAAIPLEALHAAVQWELHPEVKQEIAKAVQVVRAALARRSEGREAREA